MLLALVIFVELRFVKYGLRQMNVAFGNHLVPKRVARDFDNHIRVKQ
jgi:hypothetical protein